MSCPKTEAEFMTYFFELIGRDPDSSANDWAAVMSMDYYWNGEYMRIPEGVGPGIKQPANAPFYGLTQQWSNGPKARLFLPTDVPDALNYYTRNIQYIKDKPEGVHGVDFLWDWKYMDGNEYAPVCDADTGTPGEPSSGGDLEQRIETLEAQVARLEQQAYPKKIALKAANGKFVTAEITTDGRLIARANEVAAWEEYEFVILE